MVSVSQRLDSWIGSGQMSYDEAWYTTLEIARAVGCSKSPTLVAHLIARANVGVLLLGWVINDAGKEQRVWRIAERQLSLPGFGSGL